MIPIRDSVPARNYPVVTVALIGLNALLFVWQLSLGPVQERFLFTYGLVPARYSVPELRAYFSLGQQAAALVTFMFLHGGFWHLLGNMWSLHIFGNNVEDRLGALRFLAFYLACGLASGLTHLLLNTGSPVPTIGASGAIAGVMGAYFLLYPQAKVLTLIPILFIPWFVEVPAFFFLGIWFVLQFFNAAASRGEVAGIAWWAHVGGFVAGMLLLKAFGRLPAPASGDAMHRWTARRHSPHLQVVRPQGHPGSATLTGCLTITPREARRGAVKRITLSRGVRNQLFRVQVPPGVSDGTVLRLRGLGLPARTGASGDLLLTVTIER